MTTPDLIGAPEAVPATSAPREGLSRRTALRTAAWAGPTIALAAAAPAYASSTDPGPKKPSLRLYNSLRVEDDYVSTSGSISSASDFGSIGGQERRLNMPATGSNAPGSPGQDGYPTFQYRFRVGNDFVGTAYAADGTPISSGWHLGGLAETGSLLKGKIQIEFFVPTEGQITHGANSGNTQGFSQGLLVTGSGSSSPLPVLTNPRTGTSVSGVPASPSEDGVTVWSVNEENYNYQAYNAILDGTSASQETFQIDGAINGQRVGNMRKIILTATLPAAGLAPGEFVQIDCNWYYTLWQLGNPMNWTTYTSGPNSGHYQKIPPEGNRAFTWFTPIRASWLQGMASDAVTPTQTSMTLARGTTTVTNSNAGSNNGVWKFDGGDARWFGDQSSY